MLLHSRKLHLLWISSDLEVVDVLPPGTPPLRGLHTDMTAHLPCLWKGQGCYGVKGRKQADLLSLLA